MTKSPMTLKWTKRKERPKSRKSALFRTKLKKSSLSLSKLRNPWRLKWHKAMIPTSNQTNLSNLRRN